MLNKPVLLLDMDGPLANFDLAFWNMCQNHGFELNITSLKDPNRKRFMTENIIDPAQAMAARTIVNTSRWFIDLPVTIGALEGVQTLMEHFDVWVCTKPLEVNPWCRDDKGAWLRMYFPDLEHKMILAPKKSMVVGDILLDDAPAHGCIPNAVWTPVVFPDTFNGLGSEWEKLPTWTWGDPLENLFKVLY